MCCAIEGRILVEVLFHVGDAKEMIAASILRLSESACCTFPEYCRISV